PGGYPARARRTALQPRGHALSVRAHGRARVSRRVQYGADSGGGRHRRRGARVQVEASPRECGGFSDQSRRGTMSFTAEIPVRSFTRTSILERLRSTLAAGSPIIAASAGAGIVAKCAEIGGVDLLI